MEKTADDGKKQNKDIVTLPVYNGVSYPAFEGFIQKGSGAHILDIYNFNSRESDILICSYPKSGTHWTREIIGLLVTDKTELLESELFRTMLDQICDMAILDSVPSPRIMNTHLSFKYLPKKHIENGYKVIHVKRDPKDVCVSAYHHFRRDPRIAMNIPWSEYFEVWMDGKLPYGSWYDYEDEFRKAILNHPDQIYTVRYESLKKNTVDEIKNLATFLHLPCTIERARQIADITTFANMKSNKPERSCQISLDGKGYIFRKGVLGDWKEWFTVSQNERFESQFQSKMKEVTNYS